MTTARERLHVFLEDNPTPCLTHTGQEVATVLGVSRERVRQLFRGTYQRVTPSKVKLAPFLEAHPEAMLTKARGGMTLGEIGALIGFSGPTLSRAWRLLGLPPRSLQVKTHAEGQREALAKIIRVETCITCGREFPWKGIQERGRRYKGCRIVCCRLCGRRAALGEREMQEGWCDGRRSQDWHPP